MPPLTLHPIVLKQIQGLTPDQKLAMKQELSKNANDPVASQMVQEIDNQTGSSQQGGGQQGGGISFKNKLFKTGLGAAEGFLLGLQGRPISEHSAFQKSDLDEFTQKEMIKNKLEEQRVKNLLGQDDPANGDGVYQPEGFTSGGVTYKRKPTEEERQKNLKNKAQEEAFIASEKDKQVNASKVSRLSNLVDMIEQEYGKTNTPSGAAGVVTRPAETFTRGLQITENQRQDKAYGDFITGIRAQLARAMGEVGNLSAPEQQAVLNLVPTLLDDPETAKLKIQNLRNFVLQIQSSAGIQQNNQQYVQPTKEQAIEELRRRGILK